jgi:hypothetical protein
MIAQSHPGEDARAAAATLRALEAAAILRGLALRRRQSRLADLRTYRGMLWRTPSARFWRNLPAGFIQPCQPTLVANPPAGPGWPHDVKHDGFRILA